MQKRANYETPCIGVWPATGNPCGYLPRPSHDTCEAHAPEGDLRKPAPAEQFRCHGTNRESGERCRRSHEPGGKVCPSHGGNAPQVKAAAARNVALAKAEKLVRTYGLKIDTTAPQALLDEVQWTAGHVQWLRERIQSIEEVHAASFEPGEGSVPKDRDRHPLVWGITRVKEGGEDEGTTFEAAPSVWLTLYWKEREHLVRVCAATVKAGVDERMVRLAEDQGRIVADVLRAILGDIGLTPDQHARAMEVAPRHLRALTGGVAVPAVAEH